MTTSATNPNVPMDGNQLAKWCSGYKKAGNTFIDWVYRNSGAQIQAHADGTDRRIDLTSFSAGVDKVVAKQIPMPHHIREALDKAISLRTTVTNFYERNEAPNVSAATKNHKAFTAKLDGFRDVLGKVKYRAKYVGKASSLGPLSKGGFGVLATEEGNTIEQESAMVFEEDDLLSNMLLKEGIYQLNFLFDGAILPFATRDITPRMLAEAAWVSTALSNVACLVSNHMLRNSGLNLTELLREIGKIAETKPKELPVLFVHRDIPPFLEDFKRICTSSDGRPVIQKLSEVAATSYEKILLEEGFEMTSMRPVVQRYISDLHALCCSMDQEILGDKWVPMMPMANRVIAQRLQPSKYHHFQAGLEAMILIRTSARLIESSRVALFAAVYNQVTSTSEEIRNYINKIPSTIWVLLGSEIHSQLSVITQLCEKFMSGKHSTATSHPWSAGNLILFLLSHIYNICLPLIHRDIIIGAVIHIYDFYLRTAPTKPQVPILNRISELTSTTVFRHGTPPSGNFSAAFIAYKTRNGGATPAPVPSIATTDANSKRKQKKRRGNKKKAKESSSQSSSQDILAPTPPVSLSLAHPSPDADLKGTFLSSLQATVAAQDTTTPPLLSWTTLDLARELGPAASQEFSGELPRGRVNMLAVFGVCVEVLDALGKAWGVRRKEGEEWTVGVIERVEKEIQERGGCGESVVEVMRGFRYRDGDEAFWKLE